MSVVCVLSVLQSITKANPMYVQICMANLIMILIFCLCGAGSPLNQHLHHVPIRLPVDTETIKASQALPLYSLDCGIMDV